MIRTIGFALVAVPATLFFSTLAVVGGWTGAGHGFFDWIHRTWSGILLRAAGIGVTLRGAEHVDVGSPQIVVANHQSVFDILALFAYMPLSLRFVAKEELSRIPVFGRAMRAAGHVFIDRQDRAGAIEAMRAAGRRMKRENLSLVLFPEGTRSPDGRLRPFKKGSFVLAIETQTTMVPVAVEGGARIMQKGSLRLHPGGLRLWCAEPVPMEGLTVEDRDPLIARVRGRIAGMLEELRTGKREPIE